MYISLGRLALRGCLLDRALKGVREHAVLVGLDATDFGAEPSELAKCAGVHEVFSQSDVTGVDQHLEEHMDRLAGAVGEDDVVGRNVDVAVACQLV